MDIYREFTAADVSGVYLSGLPALREGAPPVPPVPPGCVAMPAFTYADDDTAADFGRNPGSYIAYNISGQEALLANLYVEVLF